jgi:putative Holliday junction resolvase
MVVERTGSRAEDHRRIARLVGEEEAECVVVGLPLGLDGSLGAAAKAAMAERDDLAATLDVPVELFDERLTTVSAERTLIEARVRREARRRVVDKVAAAVMLQAWLDGRGARAAGGADSDPDRVGRRPSERG